MPRRYYDYLPEFHTYHLISTIGSWILVTGILLMLGNLIKSLMSTKKFTEKNPWGGETLEWKVDTPPIHENFIDIPTVYAAPYEYKQNEINSLKTQEVK